MILDPDDPVWAKYFTAEELKEIMSDRVKLLQKLPNELQEYLDSYDKEWTTGSELCEYAEKQQHIPFIEFDKRWIRQSMVEVSELFFGTDRLNLEDYSESDLLHEL